jgi:hypothetical protein
MLNVKRDLIGKTITGIIAVPGERQAGESGASCTPAEIWMMQFSDGTYVEFVSPGARRGLRRSARRVEGLVQERQPSPQLALNVA